MATPLSAQLDSLSHRPQRQLLVSLSHNNPQDDTPFDSEKPEFQHEELESLFDLRHFHLPEMEDKGFVEYDREDNLITKGPNFDEIEPLVELIDRHSDELPDDWL